MFGKKKYTQLTLSTHSKFFRIKKKTEKSKKGINQASSPKKQIKDAGHFATTSKMYAP